MKAFPRELALFAFFILASGFVLRPLPFHLADQIPAGSDPPHHLYILNWLLNHGLSADRFEGRMFHPAHNAVLRSDLSMGTVVLMAPLTAIVDEPLIRFNLATWLALAFSGWAFCLLARSWTQSTMAGVFAGVTAVLGSHQSLHYVHLNLLSVGWLPIFLLALDRLLAQTPPPSRSGHLGEPAHFRHGEEAIEKQPSAPAWPWATKQSPEAREIASGLPERWAPRNDDRGFLSNVTDLGPSMTRNDRKGLFSALGGVSFALVASSSGYYGVAACVIAFVFFFRSPSKNALKWGALAAVVAVILLSPYLVAYARLHGEESLVRTSRELAKGSWRLTDLGSRTLLHRTWNPSLGEPLFPGLSVLGLTVVALWRGSKRERTLGLTALLLFWLGLGEPGGLYRVLALVPPFSSMRHPVTLTAVGLMLLSVLAASGVARLEKSRPSFGWLLLVIGTLETFAPRNDFFQVSPGVPPVYEALLKLPPGPVLDVPPYEASPLIWAARRGFETVNGGGAFIPAITTRIETTTQNHWLTDTYQPIDESKAAGILLNETAMRYLILPGGRRGGLDPLIQRFKGSQCFRELGEYQSDLLFEAIREASCPAWAGARTSPSLR